MVGLSTYIHGDFFMQLSTESGDGHGLWHIFKNQWSRRWEQEGMYSFRQRENIEGQNKLVQDWT